MADVDYRDNDEIETDLNKEVDQAMGQIDFEEPDLPQTLNLEEIAEVIEQISRVASEIQQVVSLIRPKPAVSQPGEVTRETPQDPVLVKAALDLLIAQISALQRLVAQLE